MPPRPLFSLLFCFFLLLSPAGVSVCRSAEPAKGVSPPAASADPSLAELSITLRSYIVRKVAGQVYETKREGRQDKSATGGSLGKSQGEPHSAAIKPPRKDGTWRTVRISAPQVAERLTLSLDHVQQPEPGRMLFDVVLTCPTHIEVEQQLWKDGIRIYSGSARARLRVHLALACELTTRLDWNAKLLPDGVFRLRVVHADLSYDQFVLEHVAGLGGDAAKLVGQVLKTIVHQWRPSLEREWLAKANAAIEKAADTKEIRIGVGSLLKSKAKPAPAEDKAVPKQPG